MISHKKGKLLQHDKKSMQGKDLEALIAAQRQELDLFIQQVTLMQEQLSTLAAEAELRRRQGRSQLEDDPAASRQAEDNNIISLRILGDELLKLGARCDELEAAMLGYPLRSALTRWSRRLEFFRLRK